MKSNTYVPRETILHERSKKPQEWRIRQGIPQRLIDAVSKGRNAILCTDMHVGIVYEHLVGYVVQELWDSNTQEKWRGPVGTLFFVQHDVGPGAGNVRYAVTCRHVIEGMIRSGATEVFIRVNMQNGFCEDFPTALGSWTLSEDSDVAVRRFDLPPEKHFWSYPIQRNAGTGLMGGADVFFIGMFCLVPGSVSVRAIVRTGTIAKAAAGVPLCFKSDPDEATECYVHLVEMRSWGGESGSPVFIYDDRFPEETQYAFDPGYGPGHDLRPSLIGLLYGQFVFPKSVMKGKKQVGISHENTGIGVVIPRGDIIKTLQDRKLVEERNRVFKVRTELSKNNPPI